MRELGRVLLRDFNGQAADLVRKAQGSADTLVQLVTAHFPMFRDHSIYAGHQVYNNMSFICEDGIFTLISNHNSHSFINELKYSLGIFTVLLADVVWVRFPIWHR